MANFFDNFKAFFKRTEISAATQLPSDPLPKAKGKQVTLPSYLTTASPSTESPLLRSDRLLQNRDITTYRIGADSRQVIRDFTRASPDLSAAVTSYVRTGITSGYTAIARNPDGTMNADATGVLQQILTRMNVLNDYSIGYDDSLTIRSISEVWARDLVTNGACCGELILDKARLPSHIQPVSPSQIRLFPSKDTLHILPKQFIAGAYRDLNIPTFFMVSLDIDILDPYPVSPIESAIQAVIMSAEFMNDIRRIVKKAIHPRVVITIDEDKFKKGVPPEYLNDVEKLNAYMVQVITDLEGKVNNLSPEDAIVIFDTIGIEITDHGNTNLSQEYTVLEDLMNSKMSTGAKVLPTVLGHGKGTSNTASAETLLFMKYVEGTVWAKLNEMFSKTLTLAMRLTGQDVYVDFSYNAIDLRPENELEAFKAMKQSRILELVSLGYLADEEASVMLTGHLPPAGFVPLVGTGFRPNTSLAPAGDGFNGASNSGSTMNQKVKSDAPTGAKSQNTKAKAELELVVGAGNG
jgi:hypothetical protein